MFLNTLKQVEHLKRICFPLDEEDISSDLLADDELELLSVLPDMIITTNSKILRVLTVVTPKKKLKVEC